MIRLQRSEKYSRAYANNVGTPQFASAVLPLAQADFPFPVAAEAASGVWKIGTPGTTGPLLIRVCPLAVAAPGATFSTQVWGWWDTDDNPDRNVLVPHLLCEVAGVVGDAPGPSVVGDPSAQKALGAAERLCDQLTVTKSWGLAPEVLSLGVGSGVAAAVEVNPRGAQYVSFLFDYLTDGAVLMNALWARTG